MVVHLLGGLVASARRRRTRASRAWSRAARAPRWNEACRWKWSFVTSRCVVRATTRPSAICRFAVARPSIGACPRRPPHTDWHEKGADSCGMARCSSNGGHRDPFRPHGGQARRAVRPARHRGEGGCDRTALRGDGAVRDRGRAGRIRQDDAACALGRGRLRVRSRGSRSTGETTTPWCSCATSRPRFTGSSPSRPRYFDALSGPGGSSWSKRVPRVGSALAALERPLVLVLDDLHLVANPSCLDVLAELFQYVPAGSQIAITSREEPALPLATLAGPGASARDRRGGPPAGRAGGRAAAGSRGSRARRRASCPS